MAPQIQGAASAQHCWQLVPFWETLAGWVGSVDFLTIELSCAWCEITKDLLLEPLLNQWGCPQSCHLWRRRNGVNSWTEMGESDALYADRWDMTLSDDDGAWPKLSFDRPICLFFVAREAC